MSRRKVWFVAMGAGALVILAIEHNAAAVPNTPPPGYPYTSRVGMVAQNTVTFSDPSLTGDGYSSGVVSTDGTGRAVTIQSTVVIFTGWQFDFHTLDYYTYMPDQLSNGFPDDSYFTFDLKDQTGEYAGVEENANWVDAAGVTWYYLFEEVNGEGHYIYFSVDSAGNPNSSSIVEVKAAKRPDRCTIMSDTGALQCTRNANGIREIPTQIRSFFARTSWFSSDLDWTWGKLKAGVQDAAKFLSDPAVIATLALIGITAGTIACCIGSVGTACTWCAIADFTLATAAFGTWYGSTTPTITTTNSNLRAAGVIGCASSACSTVTNCGPLTVNGHSFEVCSYPTSAGSCPSPWKLSGASCLLFQPL